MIFIIILISLIFASIGVAVASSKGRNQAAWFIFTFLFGGAPLFILAFLPNLKDEAKRQELNSTKLCPKCAERIKTEAIICRFCSYEFPVTNSSDASNPLINDQKDGTYIVDGLIYHDKIKAETAASAIKSPATASPSASNPLINDQKDGTYIVGGLIYHDKIKAEAAASELSSEI